MHGEVVVVGGHESDGGRALRPLLGSRATAVAGGRDLYRRVAALRERGAPVCVVPMTLGRDPALTADAARTLRALPATARAHVVLAEPFGTAEHLVGWLRAAAGKVPADQALLITAPVGDPFTDADLFRTARLVRQYGRHRTVEVALTGGDPDPAEGVRRCRALGAPHVTLLPAAWVTPPVPDPEHCSPGGPLLTASGVAGVLDARVRQAWQRRERQGDDGLVRGLAADRAHGHAHSHGPGEGHDHGHGPAEGHAHGHGPAEGHAHSHGPGEGQAHGHAHSHGPGEGQAHGHAHSHGPGEGHDHSHGPAEGHAHSHRPGEDHARPQPAAHGHASEHDHALMRSRSTR
ncbi:sirohydrochlorin chelatase [Streptomyces griseoviridis]|uniref:Cobalamin biosynthesis protein CbiX n=1 Tax=Streptomyces griseoviridis TaxID=45398 RepID=A0ABT9LQI8_STRGD|nr:cobalamin biosynthesis protein CbiX [Streptomyces griseoviridis]MDP9685803.1 hypothetical protein [Streptomyces griseoviridis]GGS77291.1 hypothetical protein GCM10010240_07900 [Streptomyces griseoviridis]